jgi:hypothetical protein
MPVTWREVETAPTRKFGSFPGEIVGVDGVAVDPVPVAESPKAIGPPVADAWMHASDGNIVAPLAVMVKLLLPVTMTQSTIYIDTFVDWTTLDRIV